MRRPEIIALAIAVTAILCAPAPAPAAALAAADGPGLPTVRVADHVSVRAAAITMGEIGVVEGAGEELARSLRSVRLGVSPMPGSWREMERGLILSQLLQGGYGPEQVRLVCPPVVRIYRESQTVSQATLESRLRDYVAANAPWSPDELEVTEVSRVGDAVVPAGELEIRVRTRGSAAYLGPTPFVVELLVDGRQARQLMMQARLSVFRDAVVAAAALPAHQVIGEADVETRRVDISSARGRTFGSAGEVVGMETTCYLQAGSVLTARSLAQPILVRRGEVVQLVASRPGFVIRVTGIAQADGRRGQVVRVLNPVSRRVVDAEVTGPQRARVIF